MSAGRDADSRRWPAGRSRSPRSTPTRWWRRFGAGGPDLGRKAERPAFAGLSSMRLTGALSNHDVGACLEALLNRKRRGAVLRPTPRTVATIADGAIQTTVLLILQERIAR